MTMPIDLVLVRHGESEGNLAKTGDPSALTREFLDRHSSQFRLTTRGIVKAEAAGAWLRANGFASFDRYYASEYVRAYETAARLGLELLPGQRWYLDFFLRERDYGLFDVMPYEERVQKYPEYLRHKARDGFFWTPPGSAESMAMVALRLGRLLDTLHRECSDKRVIVVCHGETMWALRVRLERMTQARYAELDASEDPKDRIRNCQIIHYTRRDPATGAMSRRYDWMRSVCPWDEAAAPPAWSPIVRPSFTNQELLELALAKPRLVDDE
jgi:NAD+ kinase